MIDMDSCPSCGSRKFKAVPLCKKCTRLANAPRCAYHEKHPAEHKILIEGGSTVNVCTDCKDRILMKERYYCKYCEVPVRGKTNTRAFNFAPHKDSCPRSHAFETNGLPTETCIKCGAARDEH